LTLAIVSVAVGAELTAIAQRHQPFRTWQLPSFHVIFAAGSIKVDFLLFFKVGDYCTLWSIRKRACV
jgi:hypothetical protein